MTSRRSIQLLRGVASLIATLALLVGVPLLLATLVGWPLPRTLPSIHTVEEAARSGISDQVVVKTLAVIAWIAWAQLALSLVVEVLAVARGRQAIRLPVLPGFQVTAARLIAGILVFASTVQPARGHAAPQPIPIVAESSVDSVTPLGFVVSSNGGIPTATSDAGGDVGPAASTPQHPTVTVQRHDSYWAIAERTLGDGLRWREILDLNAGRTLPDGTVITAGDETLYTGWILLLPPDATGEPVSVDVTAIPGSGAIAGRATVVVEPGDNLWTISEDRLEADLHRDPTDPEVAPYWREVVDLNQDRYVEPGNPNLILPGQVLDLPPTDYKLPNPTVGGVVTSPEAVPVEPPEAEPPDLPNTPESTAPEAPVSPPPTTLAPSQDVSDSAPEHQDGDDPGDGATLPVAVAVGGLASVALAVGLKRLLNRRRHRFANSHRGETPGATPHEQRAVHQAIVAQADEERVDDLNAVLSWLATTLAAASSSRRPRMVRHSATGLELLLDHPDPTPPAGWTATQDGSVWTLEHLPDLRGVTEGPLCPAPLLVTIGQPEDDAQLYLDLEVDGLVALVGDSDVAKDLARSVASELALGPLADTLRVVVVGDLLPPEATVLEHLRLVESWDDIADDIRSWTVASHDSIAENEWPNAFIGRAHEPDHEGLVPLAVIADRAPPPAIAELLAGNQPSSVAVVVVGTFTGAAVHVRCEVDSLNFDAIDLACAPQTMDAEQLADVCRVMAAADAPDGEQLALDLPGEAESAVATNGHLRPADDADASSAEAGAPPERPSAYDVLVRLLGDITVDGGEPLNPKPTAVVAYLALHREATTERLEEACWFGSDGHSNRRRLRDVLTECRSAIGSQHLPLNQRGVYAAGPRLITDLQLFEWHVKQAANAEPAEAIDHYRSALDLVRGRPFSYRNASRASYAWVDFEHHASRWEMRVAHIAQACAEMHLDAQQPSDAVAMLQRIGEALPLNGAIVEALMRAHIAAGDRATAEGVYQGYRAALEQAGLGDPEDSIEELRLEQLQRSK